MTWPQTGLDWHPTSPNIPNLDSVAGYPMTGLGAQLGNFRHGIGTPHPFRLLSFEGKKAVEIKSELDQIDLDGLDFKLKSVRDDSGNLIEGVYIVLSDWNAWNPTELAFEMMRIAAKWESPNPFREATEAEMKLFNKHVGSSLWWKSFLNEGSSVSVKQFIRDWDLETKEFRKQIQNFLLY